MKVFKLLFSKILPVFILLLIQLALIFTTLILLEYFVWFQILSAVIGVIVFLTIINKRENPEFKLPWLVLLMTLPFFTVTTYLLFANPKLPKRDYSRLLTVFTQTGKFTEKVSLPVNLPREVGCTEDYLRATAYSHGYTDSKVTYFKLGEEFFADLKTELEKAEKYIFMEYFIVHLGKMWSEIHEILLKKIAEGVEVRLMYDDIGTVGELKSNYYKKLRKEGINCYKFNSFRPVLSGIHNNRDHRKITVIDGKVGYTGGVNIGDEYINENDRLGHWKDTAIKIEGAAVNNLLSLFLQLFDMNSKTQSDYEKYYVKEHEIYENCGYVHPFGDGPKPFYTELIGENNYINLINSAKDYCYITTPYLIPDYNLVTALRNAALRGVDVRIVTPHIPDKKIIFNMTRSNYPQLLKAGVKIYEYSPGFIHAKMLVADDKVAFVGTINLDYRSLVHHFECGAVMYGAPCIRDIKEDVEATIGVSQECNLYNFKMGRFSSFVNAVLNVFSPML